MVRATPPVVHVVDEVQHRDLADTGRGAQSDGQLVRNACGSARSGTHRFRRRLIHPRHRCKAHRPHAIVEQVIADLKHGPLAHLPSGSFAANSAWAVCAAMAYNLTRAAGVVASVFHAKATTGTSRAQLINVPGRLARSARKLVLHLPVDWP